MAFFLQVVFHCVCLKQVGLKREDAKAMENFRSACLRMSSEICTFVKCMVCMFSGLNTPKLQTSGLTRKGRPYFTTYQTHFLRQYRQVFHKQVKNRHQYQV